MSDGLPRLLRRSLALAARDCIAGGGQPLLTSRSLPSPVSSRAQKEPHVYALAEAAYSSMRRLGKDCVVIISGRRVTECVCARLRRGTGIEMRLMHREESV